jgi:thiamine-phosphate pyrophosphorylase
LTIEIPHPTLCLVSDRKRTGGRPLLDLISEAAAAGVDLIQIRERDMDDRDLIALVRGAIASVRGTDARILVNDRVDIAIASGAAGVHLRADSMAAPRVRALAGGAFIVGRSVHGEREAEAAERAGGCDYLIFGAVFPSASKPPDHQSAGLDALGAVCGRVRLPVLAIGGITAARAPAVAAAGAAGIAAIGLFAEDGHLPATVIALHRAFDTRS